MFKHRRPISLELVSSSIFAVGKLLPKNVRSTLTHWNIKHQV